MMSTAVAENKETTGSACTSPKDCACVMTPAADILETENELTIQLNMPGVTKDNIDVQFEQGALQVSGLREGTADRNSVRYERSFRLGDTIDASGISAAYRQGVLSIRLPKCESARQRKIEVKAE